MSLKPPFRADHVGSFLRPAALLKAREQAREGAIDATALRMAEDEAIRGVVTLQEQLGFHGITDGEFRRTFFHTDFLLQLAGIEEQGGMEVSFQHAAGKNVNYAPPRMVVTGRIRHVKPIQRADFEFLAGVTTQTPKVSIPSPTMLHFRAGREGISQSVYPDMAEFFADVAAAYRAEIADLASAGCRYLQLDDTNLAYLCDDRQRENARKRGLDPDDLPRHYARMINDAISDAPADMFFGVHLCRGNFRSSWAAEGGYEPVAEVMFNELDVDAFFLEYDDARSGDFKPLRFVPKGKTVVLGLITTKLGDLETRESILRRIEEAARYIPMDQLALSPQCGFSSTVHGNDIVFDQQREKLRLVIEVAEKAWGRST